MRRTRINGYRGRGKSGKKVEIVSKRLKTRSKVTDHVLWHTPRTTFHSSYGSPRAVEKRSFFPEADPFLFTATCGTRFHAHAPLLQILVNKNPRVFSWGEAWISFVWFCRYKRSGESWDEFDAVIWRVTASDWNARMPSVFLDSVARFVPTFSRVSHTCRYETMLAYFKKCMIWDGGI